VLHGNAAELQTEFTGRQFNNNDFFREAPFFSERRIHIWIGVPWFDEAALARRKTPFNRLVK